MIDRRFALPLTLALFTSVALAAEPQPKSGAPKVKTVKPPAQQAMKAVNRLPDNHPGEQLVDNLLEMTPREREKALQKFPPDRREKIAQRLSEIQKFPPGMQHSARVRLEMMNNLPPQTRNQVRRSTQQYLDLPELRQMAISHELQRMAALPDEERRAYMNGEEFRNRYTVSEQQMMGNLMQVVPPPREKGWTNRPVLFG